MELAIIADEITAVGWRLAGARVYEPDAAAVADSLRAAAHGADLILLTAALAMHVPANELEQALLASAPLLLLIPDMRHTSEPADIETDARRALGITE